MQTTFPKATERKVIIGANNEKYRIAPDYKAITNEEGSYLYTIVSNQYKLIQHEDILTMVGECINENIEYGKYTEEQSFTHFGGRMRAQFKFPEAEVEITHNGKPDTVNPQIEVFNSYDTSWKFQLLFGAFRLICSNGLVIGEKVLHLQKRHIESLSLDREVIKAVLIQYMRTFSEQKEIWKNWVDRTISQAEAKEIVEKRLNFGKTGIEEISSEIELSSGQSIESKVISYWIFYNILCQYITHKVNSINKQKLLYEQMRKIF